MDSWDTWRQIQRLIDSVRPLQQEAKRLQRVYDQLSKPSALDMQVQQLITAQERMLNAAQEPIRARALLAEFAKTQAALTQPTALFATAQMLEAAIRPILDVQRLSAGDTGIRALFERLNTGFAHAPFIAELNLSEEEEAGEEAPSDEALIERIESQLIEVAPPESLEALRGVQFTPITLLDSALRNPEMMRQMNARAFEEFIASLLEQLGFEDLVLTRRAKDGGRDVLATQHVSGVPIFFAFECKRYAAKRPVGIAFARALLGTITHGPSRATKGVLVTTSRFTSGARNFILTEPQLDGKDFDGVVGWLRDYAKRHDGRAKASGGQ